MAEAGRRGLSPVCFFAYNGVRLAETGRAGDTALRDGMLYKYEAVSPTGDTVRGTVEAESEVGAEERLWQSNLTIVRLRAYRPPPTLDEALPTLFGVKRDDIINFSRQLASLLDAGISLLPALDALHDQVTKPALKKVLRKLTDDLRAGVLFSAACARQSDVFPSVFMKLVGIAEQTGNLPVMLLQIANYMEKEAALAQRLQRSLTYPAVVLLIAGGALFVVVNFVLPSLTSLLKEVGGELPLASRILLEGAGFVSRNLLYIAGGVFAVVVFLVWYLRTPGGAYNRDRFFLRAPLLKELVLKSNLARLTRTTSLLMQSGIPVMEVIELSIATPLNQVIRDALVTVRDDIRAGQSISQAIAAQKVFPTLVSQMIGVGEQTGRLEKNLESLANMYEAETDRAMATLVGAIEPAMILMLGVVVAFVAISVISPIYGAIQQVR